MLKGNNLYKKILSYFITLVCGIALYFLLINKWDQLSSLAITSTDNSAMDLKFDTNLLIITILISVFFILGLGYSLINNKRK